MWYSVEAKGKQGKLSKECKDCAMRHLEDIQKVVKLTKAQVTAAKKIILLDRRIYERLARKKAV